MTLILEGQTSTSNAGCLPVLYVYLASFSHSIFDISSRSQINTVTRSLEFLHSTPPPHLMSDQMSLSSC